ncbi:hypothetical protein STRDD10_00057 [Streptococcus sp. DD10]|nr:hypothetical protein STRDD10_00057 [Streptococcus sp. DD10]
MNQLEIEFKTLLHHKDYLKLLPLFKESKAIKQTNHYFDTKDWRLKEKKLLFVSVLLKKVLN